MNKLSAFFSNLIASSATDIDGFSIKVKGERTLELLDEGRAAVADPEFVQRHGNYWHFVEQKHPEYLLVSTGRLVIVKVLPDNAIDAAA